ncbi:MAG: cytochrome c3 family protein [Thermodesulfobacteriota bacterium]
MRHLTKKTVPIIIMIVFVSLGLLNGFAYGEVPNGANDICFDECHSEIREKIETEEAHMPVKEGRCAECHNPHTSKHTGLLNYLPGKLCFQCHEEEKGFAGPFVHEPVEAGGCLFCHQHHSSIYKGLLKKTGSDLCFECHLKQEVIIRAIVHKPVEEGNCAACHLPHSSDEEKLLLKDKRELCIGCHTGQDEAFAQSHLDYSVVSSDCLSCHSPHSSDRKGLLRVNLHKPFADNNCSACHLTDSIEVLKDGISLCMKCHEDTREGFYKTYSHLTAGKKTNACNNCHNPHASDRKGLLRDREDRVCYQCHADTRQYVAESKFTHPNLENCSDCHTPHGSNNALFLTLVGEAQCSAEQCHPAQGRFTHPVGEEIIDPRSKMPMDCSTCHNPMGAPEQFILRSGKDRELCIPCHQL